MSKSVSVNNCISLWPRDEIVHRTWLYDSWDSFPATLSFITFECFSNTYIFTKETTTIVLTIAETQKFGWGRGKGFIEVCGPVQLNSERNTGPCIYIP